LTTQHWVSQIVGSCYIDPLQSAAELRGGNFKQVPADRDDGPHVSFLTV
jgi:hypothetical protein